MIGTGERARATASLRDLGAAVSANIEEGPERSVATSDGEDRDPREIVGAIGARLGPVTGEPHHQRTASDEFLLLPFVALRAGVGRDIVAPRRISQRGCLGVDVVEQLLEKTDFDRSVHALPASTVQYRVHHPPLRDDLQRYDLLPTKRGRLMLVLSRAIWSDQPRSRSRVTP